jgi:hypothetical protein
MDVALLVVAILTLLIGLPPALDALGMDIRMFGRRTRVPPEHPDLRYKKKRVWLPFVMSAAGLILAAFAAYHFFHPRITTRIVEKPAEKTGPQECPKLDCPTSQATPGRKHVTAQSSAPAPAAHPPAVTQTCPNGICIGGENSGNPTVNNFGSPPPNFSYSEASQRSPSGCSDLEQMTTIHIKTDRPVPGAMVGVVMSGPIDMEPKCWDKHKPDLIGAMEKQLTVTGPLTLGSGNIPNSFCIQVLMPSAFTESQEIIATVVSKESVHVIKVFEVGQPYP